jgi:hypothetical protein
MEHTRWQLELMNIFTAMYGPCDFLCTQTLKYRVRAPNAWIQLIGKGRDPSPSLCFPRTYQTRHVSPNPPVVFDASCASSVVRSYRRRSRIVMSTESMTARMRNKMWRGDKRVLTASIPVSSLRSSAENAGCRHLCQQCSW